MSGPADDGAFLESIELRGLVVTPSDGPPPEIPGFRILRELGRGSNGIVFEAEQLLPPRRVALKLLQPSFGSLVGWSRFEREAAALGRLRHPGIAALLGAGVAETPRGPQPWFAMELVPGEPLDDYVRRNALDRERRLRLLVQVCAAVEEAHRHAVVHRDLKPANLLVEAGDRARVLDFGIARLLDADAATRATASGELLGTLAYMSPEQVTDGRHVDARSDVYSLGVVLHELLVGRPPHETADRPLAAALRLICEVDPVPISAIDPTLRGDLANIVGKALEKEPARRYPSAGALGADLVRHLEHRPVLARTPSLLGRAAKFARRHRGPVVGATIAVLAVAGGWAATSVGWSETRTALAKSEERRLAAVALVLGDMERIEKLGEVSGAASIRREMLDRATAFVADQGLDADARAGEPAAMDALASILDVRARVLLRDRQPDAAEASLRDAIELRRRLLERGSVLGELEAALRSERRLLADCHTARGELDRARSLALEGIAEIEPLLARRGDDAGLLAELSDEQRRLTGLEERLTGADAARAVAVAWMATCERRLRIDATDRSARLEMCHALHERVDLALAQPDLAEAARCAAASLELAESLANEFADDVDCGRALQQSLRRSTSVALEGRDVATADHFRERMRRMTRRLAIENPDRPEIRSELASGIRELDVRPWMRSSPTAVNGRRILISEIEAVDTSRDPTRAERTHAALTQLVVARVELYASGGVGNPETFRQGIRRLEKLFQEQPDDPWVASSLANALLDPDYPACRDAERAVEVLRAYGAGRRDAPLDWARELADSIEALGDPATATRLRSEMSKLADSGSPAGG